MGPQFKVSSERQLIIVWLTSPGIEPTTLILQVERFNHRAMRAGTDNSNLLLPYYKAMQNKANIVYKKPLQLHALYLVSTTAQLVEHSTENSMLWVRFQGLSTQQSLNE